MPLLISGIFTRLREEAHGCDYPDFAANSIAAADILTATVARIAKSAGLDLTGIPFWRNPRRDIIGASPRTKPIYLTWIVADILDAAGHRADEIDKELRAAVRTAISRSPDAASIVVELAERRQLTDLADVFASIREGVRA